MNILTTIQVAAIAVMIVGLVLVGAKVRRTGLGLLLGSLLVGVGCAAANDAAWYVQAIYGGLIGYFAVQFGTALRKSGAR
ncbi:hypothetical protein [Actinomadura madurae]|uniref:hypothetical protein n=1 Tax=Actinomadura madurae TaxID=1993 RepID=UPI0020D218E3|nr:hypothetical protein [Actinomadura madurae]MCP9947178.1 hypothetical protein [Actinomadura madurae]MCP9963944.1 hypothetical protein [Actinomadura madurae]MCP9976418.1 hypothetical protein [Actinomadura madurae]MCQ0012089.1 hypothetical protein [Actinomadura madurae]MCQ0012611.1 hypothetical protein [Actinomadura madurae]